MTPDQKFLLYDIQARLEEVMTCLQVAGRFITSKEDGMMAAKSGEQWLKEALDQLKSLTEGEGS